MSVALVSSSAFSNNALMPSGLRFGLRRSSTTPGLRSGLRRLSAARGSCAVGGARECSTRVAAGMRRIGWIDWARRSPFPERTFGCIWRSCVSLPCRSWECSTSSDTSLCWSTSSSEVGFSDCSLLGSLTTCLRECFFGLLVAWECAARFRIGDSGSWQIAGGKCRGSASAAVSRVTS
jgi:hypothetical protein